jgi:ubiquinone/menaquinone biosynthesis C-methylase UbiE
VSADPDVQRAEMRERWERAAAGWGKRAASVRDEGMPVSTWMIEQAELQPGQQVLELAAGPGDTGFLAAELIRPGGVLICSDAAAAMLDVARGRAHDLGISNVEFKQLELEWIDLPTATVDAILCRWALMLSLDPATALHEARRVLRPGGRIALAVWDQRSHNPWATITTDALIQRGLAEPAPSEPGVPGMFALAQPGLLSEMLEAAGFVEVVVEAVAIERPYASVEEYVEETLDLSLSFSEAMGRLDEDGRGSVHGVIGRLMEPFRRDHGGWSLPGRSIVAAASS